MTSYSVVWRVLLLALILTSRIDPARSDDDDDDDDDDDIETNGNTTIATTAENTTRDQDSGQSAFGPVSGRSLVLEVTLASPRPPVKVIFNQTMLERWFYKLCTGGYLRLSSCVSSSGYVTDVQAEQGGPDQQLYGSTYGCELVYVTDGHKITCHRRLKEAECDASASCFTPVLTNHDPSKCYLAKFGTIWQTPQALTVLEYDHNLLQLEACSQDCSYPFVPTPATGPGGGHGQSTTGNHQTQPTPPLEPNRFLTDDSEDNTSVYIYMGIGVAVSVVTLAVLVVIIVYCVMKRRALEKALANSKGGVANQGFSPVVEAPPNEYKGAGRNTKNVTESKSEEESHYDYIDDHRFATSSGSSYSNLKEESKYNHDYKTLNRPRVGVDDAELEGEGVYQYNSGQDLEYVELEDGAAMETLTSPSTRTSDTQEMQRTSNNDTVAETDDPNDYLDPCPPNLDVEPPQSSPPTVPYNSYLEVLPPAPRPDPTMSPFKVQGRITLIHAPSMIPVRGKGQSSMSPTSSVTPAKDRVALRVTALKGQAALRGQGRSSLPPQSVADSLGPQPPLPRRNPTFHTYSHPESIEILK